MASPDGAARWQSTCSTSGRSMSLREWVRSVLLSGPVRFRLLGRVTQAFATDMFSITQECSYQYIMRPDVQLRIASYRDLLDDSVPWADRGRRGRIFLPASVLGSPRHRALLRNDALAICARRGLPTFFITVTCNPAWEDIRRSLPPGAKASDHPEICGMVFHVKLMELLDDLRKGRPWGGAPSDYYLCAVEFQARGLPHAHIVVRVPGIDLRDTKVLDELISAEHSADPTLSALVDRYMTPRHTHRCGGAGDPKRCQYRFPVPVTPVSFWDDDHQRVVYRRRGLHGDDSNVVEHNPFLLRKMECHVNVRAVRNFRCVAYLFKYLYKPDVGDDTVLVKVTAPQAGGPSGVDGTDGAAAAPAPDGGGVGCAPEPPVINEVDRFRRERIVTASEAMWRIFGRRMYHRSATVINLPVHVPEGFHVFIPPSARGDQAATARLAAAASLRNPLEQYFCRPPQLAHLRYQEYFERYTVRVPGGQGASAWPGAGPDGDGPDEDEGDDCPDRDDGAGGDGGGVADRMVDLRGCLVVRRSRSRVVVARMATRRPSAGDVYFFRLLLLHRPAASHDDLLAGAPTPSQACKEAGLLHDEMEGAAVMKEAIDGHASPDMLRRLLITLALDGCSPVDLMREYATRLVADWAAEAGEGSADAPSARLLARLLAHVRTELWAVNVSPDTRGLPRLVAGMAPEPRVPALEREIDQHRPEICHSRVLGALALGLNDRQARFYDAALSALGGGAARLPFQAFLDARGGRGKTFVLNLLVDTLRARREVVTVCASTGIAAIDYPGGRTAHSTFRIPLSKAGGRKDRRATCGLDLGSDAARVLRASRLIVWDEVGMTHRSDLAAVDRLLQQVRDAHDVPFGGADIVFAGDFRQCAVVVPGASDEEVAAASCASCPQFRHVRLFRLTENMRARDDGDWGAFVDSLGEPTAAPEALAASPGTPVHRQVLLPGSVAVDTDPEQALRRVFGDATQEDMHARAVLALNNAAVDAFNALWLARGVRGEALRLEGVSQAPDDTDVDQSFLQRCQGRSHSTPPHVIDAKIGCMLMLTRNVNPGARLMNGTRCFLEWVSPSGKLMRVRVAGTGAREFVPRVRFAFDLPGLGVEVARVQFPVRLAYAITVNKSQGKTLRRAALDLAAGQPFGHGQLYVAASRVPSSAGFSVVVPEAPADGIVRVNNIIDPRLLFKPTPDQEDQD